MRFAGNSSRCIKTARSEGHDHYRNIPVPNLGSVLPSQLKRSLLSSLKLVAACNVDRILMRKVAYIGRDGFREDLFSVAR